MQLARVRWLARMVVVVPFAPVGETKRSIRCGWRRTRAKI
jgi:hypothetical protein